MSTCLHHVGVMEEAALIRLVDAVAATHPAQLEVIRAFQPLLLGRNRLLAEAGDAVSAPLNRQSVPVEPDIAHEALLRLLDAVGEGFPGLWEGAARLRERLSPPLSARLCRAWFMGDGGLISELGDKLDVSAELLDFALGQTCRVLMARAAAGLPEAPEDATRQTCPYCGGVPELSVIHGIGEKVGVRSLVCGQCGRAWRYRRTACPACEADAAGTLQSLYVDGCPEERGVWCGSCGCYVLELDIRHRELCPEQCQALALGLGHLDILMQQEGKSSLAMQSRESEHA